MLSTIPRLLTAFCVFIFCLPLAAQKWQMQFQHDELRTELTLVDIQFASATRGVAVGYRVNATEVSPAPFRVPAARRPGSKPVALVTSDGGAHWQQVPLKEDPVSLFFLNENVGWMVTPKSLWKTTESGKSWTKVGKLKTAERVYFKDENRGWAVGPEAVAETSDGGRNWKPAKVSPAPEGDQKFTVYNWVLFRSEEAGVITGSNQPAGSMWRSGQTQGRETPHLNYMLQTIDGGQTWRSSSSSMFGEITRVRSAPRGQTIGVIEHSTSFKVPSEVFGATRGDVPAEIVFEDAKFFVSDVWVTSGGVFYIAGVSAATRAHDLVAQKVKVMRSRDLKSWEDIPVDYRAVANRVFLAGADDEHLWLATNNGMILKLAN